MMRFIFAAVLVLCATAGAFPGTATPPSEGPLSHLGFLDPSRLTIQNSMYVGYASNGSQRHAGGALTTTLGYALHPRFTMRATLSKEFTFMGRGPSDEGIALSGVELEWKPSPSLFVHVAFSSPAASWRDPRLMTWR